MSTKKKAPSTFASLPIQRNTKDRIDRVGVPTDFLIHEFSGLWRSAH